MLKVIFVLVIFSRLDAVQNKDEQIEDASEIGTESTATCESPIEAKGCNNGSHLVIDLNPLTATLIKAKYENDCCEFRKINDSVFAANLSCDNFCRYYNIFSLGDCEAFYYLNGSFLQSRVKNECPNMEAFAVGLLGCPLSNLTANSFHNSLYGAISLNVSWDGIDIDEIVEISVVKNENSIKQRCGLDIPPSDYSLTEKNVEIFSDTNGIATTCGYNVIIENEFFRCSKYYMVPDCVGPKCNCQKFALTPNITSVKHLFKDSFLIRWDPGWVENTPYTIKEIKFTYERYDKPSSSPPEADVIETDLEGHTSTVLMKLFEGQNYTLTGLFFNNYTCSEEVSFDFRAPKSFNFMNTYIILSLLLFLALFLAVWKYKTIQKWMHKVLNCVVPNQNCEPIEIPLVRLQDGQVSMSANVNYTPAEFLQGICDEFEVPRNRIIIKERIGRGAFGQVYSAKAMGIGGVEGYRMVAVKTLGEGEGENITREVMNDFISEIEIFKKIGNHPNVVSLLGCCTLEAPYMIIMELVPCGNLKKYLEVLREQWLQRKKNEQVFFPHTSDTDETNNTFLKVPNNPLTPLLSDYARSIKPVLDHVELQKFAFQIAKGMAHLEKVSITHRDLAARNILINQNKTLKISDFGLSRHGPYINHRSRKLPLRWMAVEAIVEQKYDSKSDVWSFGVVLWEIGTLGAFPYESVPDSYVQQFLQTGGRLKRPEICTDDLYSIMRRCWAADPDDRPTFRELVDKLDVKKQKVYVDFNQLNPMYVFPPSEITHVENPVKVIDI